MEERELKENKPKCEKCGSHFIYIRIKDNSLVCRSCGNITKREKKNA